MAYSDFQIIRRLHSPFTNRRAAIILALAMTSVIAYVDCFIMPNIALGLLYCIPMMLISAPLKPGEICEMALIYTFLREAFKPFAFENDVATRLLTTFVAFMGMGFLAREIDRRKKNAEAHAAELTEQI